MKISYGELATIINSIIKTDYRLDVEDIEVEELLEFLTLYPTDMIDII